MRVLTNGSIAYFGIPERMQETAGLKVPAGVRLNYHHQACSLYRLVLRRARPCTEMHGIRKVDVMSVIESAGGSLGSIEEDRGKNWLAYRYLVSKV
jgi:hypothetical protein